MNLRRWRIGRLVVAASLPALVAVGIFAMLGTSSEENTISAKDSAQMSRIVDRHWASVQHVWPEEYRGNGAKKLPDVVKAEMKAARKSVADEVTTGKLAEWESIFDPGGFLEEVRASGTFVTDSGYEVLSTTEPVPVAVGVAQADVVVRLWSVQYDVDSAGDATADPYRVENENTYRYTFEKIDGKWRISVQDLISNPL